MLSNVRGIAQIAVRYLEYSNRILSIMSMLVIATLVFIVTWQVLMRYFFEESTGWVFEIAEYSMALVVFLPLARAEQLGQHIRVDAVTSRLSPKTTSRLNVIVLFLSMVFVSIFTWSAIRYARLAYDRGWNSGPYKLGWDLWPTMACIAVALLILNLNLLVSLIRQVDGLRSR